MNAIPARNVESPMPHPSGRPVLLAALLAAAAALPAWAQQSMRPAATPAAGQPVATLEIDGLATTPGQPSGATGHGERIDVESYTWSTDTTAVGDHGEQIVAHGARLPPATRPSDGPGTLTIVWRPDGRTPAFRAALAEKRVFPLVTLALPPAQPGARPQVATMREVTVALIRPATRLQLMADARSAASGGTTRTEQIAFAYKTIHFGY
jgi:hypothetical protein